MSEPILIKGHFMHANPRTMGRYYHPTLTQEIVRKYKLECAIKKMHSDAEKIAARWMYELNHEMDLLK